MYALGHPRRGNLQRSAVTLYRSRRFPRVSCAHLLETDEDGDAQVDIRNLDEGIRLGIAAKQAVIDAAADGAVRHDSIGSRSADSHGVALARFERRRLTRAEVGI